jgi:predicted DCC family thiol-disulfide oxidoreductase YuxK
MSLMNEPSTSLTQAPPTAFERLVLFDGVCAVCDATVQWILDHDPDGLFHFAPLQGETAAAVLARHPELPADLDSIVLIEVGAGGAERASWHSAAILRIAGSLRAPWRLLSVFQVVPWFLRDPFYRGFAAIRYRVFGKLESCRMPDPGTEDRFLP